MNREDAYDLLDKLNAPEHLKKHVRLVGEAADALLSILVGLQVAIDADFVRAGVVIHDVGKIVHINELAESGSEHESEGQKLLEERSVETELSRVCLSHARWHSMECSIEELVIALSDKLWKGKRESKLELLVIDRVAEQLNKERWDIFSDLDTEFESIASEGHERLQRSS